jgi:hypothetical protein
MRELSSLVLENKEFEYFYVLRSDSCSDHGTKINTFACRGQSGLIILDE